MKLSSFLPSILYGKNPQNSTISRSWLTPFRGTVKVNFDAAHLPTTIGVIIQDSTHISHTFATKVSSNDDIELIEGLTLLQAFTSHQLAILVV